MDKPIPEAVRALVAKWRKRVPDAAGDSARVLMREHCADELEAALTAAQQRVDFEPEHDGDTCRANDLYAGNSVGWWKSKADNYGAGLLKVCRALGDIGVKMDGSTPCWEYVARLTPALPLPAAAQQQGQAVAWMCWHPNVNDGRLMPMERDLTSEAKAVGWQSRPLIYGDTAPPSAPVGVEGLMQLARNWCLAWGEWAHDNDPDCRKENAAEAALRTALESAIAQQPAACPRCDGTGEADSGGIHPWGAPAMIRCECQQPAAVDEARVVETIRKALHHSYGAGHTDYVNFTEALDFLATQHQEPTT